VSQDEPPQSKGKLKADGEGDGESSGSTPAPDTEARAEKHAADSVARNGVRATPPDGEQDASSDDEPQPDEPAATGAETVVGDEPAGSERQRETEAPKRKPETWTNTLLWLAGILLLLGIELYIYGHDGYVQVCVGIQEITKFELRHEVKTKANAKHHPFCAERMNLGMWSSSEEHGKAALEEACHSAARVVGMERKQHCLRNDDPWKRFVDTQQVMPWDPRFYRRLLWLD
jgi:hypothetical protein